MVLFVTRPGRQGTGGSVVPTARPHLATDILHGFPILECGLRRQEICMFAILRVLLDGSACPRKPAASCQTDSIFRKDLCQSIRELTNKVPICPSRYS